MSSSEAQVVDLESFRRKRASSRAFAPPLIPYWGPVYVWWVPIWGFLPGRFLG
jgi:hypothetical protein